MWSIGLIGHPVSQSFSPEYFRQKFEDLGLSNWAYKAFDLTDLNTFNTWWQTQNRLVALNVTIPHKQNIIAHCSEISDQVNSIGAANLIIQSAERPDQFKAFNTDHSGFAEALCLIQLQQYLFAILTKLKIHFDIYCYRQQHVRLRYLL